MRKPRMTTDEDPGVLQQSMHLCTCVVYDCKKGSGECLSEPQGREEGQPQSHHEHKHSEGGSGVAKGGEGGRRVGGRSEGVAAGRRVATAPSGRMGPMRAK